MSRRGLNLKFIISLLSASVLVSCDDPPSNSLTLQHADLTFVVPAASSNCADKRSGTSPIPASLATDSFLITPFKLVWAGSQELVHSVMTIEASHPFLEGGKFTCTISTTDMDESFGPSPHAPNTTIDMNDPLLGAACGIGCGGLKRKAGYENSSFSATATIEFLGYSQDPDGSNGKPVRTNSQVRLNFF